MIEDEALAKIDEISNNAYVVFRSNYRKNADVPLDVLLDGLFGITDLEAILTILKINEENNEK